MIKSIVQFRIRSFVGRSRGTMVQGILWYKVYQLCSEDCYLWADSKRQTQLIDDLFPSRRTSSSPPVTVQRGSRSEGCASVFTVGGRHSCVVRTISHRCWGCYMLGKFTVYLPGVSDPQTFWFQDPFTFKFSEDPMGLGRLCLLIFSA